MYQRGDVGSAKDKLLAKSAANPPQAPAGKVKFWEQPRRGKLQDTLERFNQKAEDTKKELERNPFSKTYVRPVYAISDEGYGRPEHGSLTEKRGMAAGDSISREIVQLCQVISDHGRRGPDGKTTITFGELFELYINISNKVVGMLLRARKHGLVHFKGEMLYQGRDEAAVVTLLRPLHQIVASVGRSGDPARCLREDGTPDPLIYH